MVNVLSLSLVTTPPNAIVRRIFGAPSRRSAQPDTRRSPSPSAMPLSIAGLIRICRVLVRIVPFGFTWSSQKADTRARRVKRGLLREVGAVGSKVPLLLTSVMRAYYVFHLDRVHMPMYPDYSVVPSSDWSELAELARITTGSEGSFGKRYALNTCARPAFGLGAPHVSISLATRLKL